MNHVKEELTITTKKKKTYPEETNIWWVMLGIIAV
jgi:hypothetical protein